MPHPTKRSIRHPILLAHARKLRKEITKEESMLWAILRDRRLGEWKFRRQYVIEPYIADFCCVSAKLIVEVDGTTHDQRQEIDRDRDSYLTSQGYCILRFWNEDVAYRENWVVERIIDACNAHLK